MRKPPYTKKRGNVWWYRRPVPAKLQSIIGKVEFTCSLETSDMEVARTRAAFQNAEVAVEIQEAKARLNIQQATELYPVPVTLPPEAIQYIRKAVYARIMQEDERERDSWPNEDNLEGYESVRSNQFDDLETALKQMGQGKFVHNDTKQMIGRELKAIGVDLPLSAPNWEEAARAAANGMLEALRSTRPRMMKGDAWQYVPSPDMPPKPQALQPQPAPEAALVLGTVIDDYITNLKQNEFKRKVVRCLQLFGAIVGRDTPVKAIRQKTVTGFLRDICKLPLEWAKQYDKGASVADMLVEGTDKAMNPTTYVDNYRAPLGTFLVASQRDYGDEGFPALTVVGINYSGTRVADEDKQRALSPVELQTLYEGEQFAAIAKDPEQEALYWFAVVLLFTGARPRELCQTNPQVDFGQEEGNWYMDISETTTPGKGVTKSVKTGEARRVPFHPELVRLGFPKYVQRVKDEGADRLFPSFRIKAGNPYSANGNLFSDLLKRTGLYDRKAPPGKLVTGAYVLRKSFITQCSHQGVVSKELTGHSDGKTTAIQDKHYITEGELFAKKKSELRKLVMPIQIPSRYEPIL